MELQKFITKSLVEIMNGLKEAQDQLKDSHARICPSLSKGLTAGGQQAFLGASTKGQPISLIEFDIAVEVSGEKSGEGGIKVWQIVNAGGKISEGEKEASRIKFSVPVAYPDVAD